MPQQPQKGNRPSRLQGDVLNGRDSLIVTEANNVEHFTTLARLREEPEKQPVPLKYEQVPDSNTANWMLVSMGDLPRLQLALNNFRKPNKQPGYIYSKACSSTLIWSGSEGNNVPIELFGQHAFGFTLDPSKILVPHAEFYAQDTMSLVPQDQSEQEMIDDIYSGHGRTTSKYPEKKGRTLTYRFRASKWITNQAKWRRPPGSTGKYGVYEKKGSADIFAGQVWRKYFKRQNSSLNEALVLQKGDQNPINGIIIRAELFHQITLKEKRRLIEILKNNGHINLYIYDRTLTEHIIREVGKKEAIALLSSEITKVDSKSYTPFKGFKSKPAQRRIQVLEQQQREYQSRTLLEDSSRYISSKHHRPNR